MQLYAQAAVRDVVLDAQFAYADRVKTLLAQRGVLPCAYVHTYGCQQNVSDSERMKGFLVQMGFSFTEDPAAANLILFNTCAVREHAQDRVYGHIGRLKALKRKNPDLLILLCGCMVQQPHVAKRIQSSFPYVDIVFGTKQTHRISELIYRRLNGSNRIFALEDDSSAVIEGQPVFRDDDKKGWLPIMYGCNNFCTYCVVPYVRGRERSRDPQAVLAEAKEMIASGVKEITLLGQNVNSYGKGEAHGVNFAKLLRMINDLPGEFRIRFMTSHPKDCTEELLLAMRDCPKVCRHLHLPVQCGSDEILKRMNRHYDSMAYLQLVQKAKTLMPDLLLTSDIIVGFPGESYEDFLKTVELVKTVEYYSLFTFIFSPRENTPAATMPDPVSREEKGRWFTQLLQIQEQIAKQVCSKLVGREEMVFCEEYDASTGLVTGHGNGPHTVSFIGSADMLGTFKKVRITEYNGVLIGNIIE